MKVLARTTTAEALLGILSMGPMTGYEIKQRIEQTIGNFWSESFGQIYPALLKLTKAGLISAEETGKAGRKVYSLTEDGRVRLQEWLTVMPVSQPRRNERLLKLFFGANGNLEDTREQVLATREKYFQDLVRFQAMEPEIRSRRAGNPGLPFWMMALRYGEAEARAVVEWADETLREINRLQLDKSKGER